MVVNAASFARVARHNAACDINGQRENALALVGGFGMVCMRQVTETKEKGIRDALGCRML